MIDLTAHAEGIVVPVRAHAGARRNAITGAQAGQLQVSVTQAPERGKANKAILELLAKKLGLRKNQLELLTGETGPQKRFLVHGVSNDELTRKLEQLLAPGS